MKSNSVGSSVNTLIHIFMMYSKSVNVMMALVSPLDLTIWMPLYVTCKTFITPIMIPFTSFEFRGVNVTGSPTGKNVMQT